MSAAVYRGELEMRLSILRAISFCLQGVSIVGGGALGAGSGIEGFTREQGFEQKTSEIDPFSFC